MGLLDNLKPNASTLLEHAAARLAERFELGSVVKVYKRTPTGPVSEEILAELQHTDLTLLGVADCGGCTAWTLHDAIELERRGIPTVTFASRAFLAMAASQAALRGVKALPLVCLPHPFSPLSAEDVRSCVDGLIELLVKAILPSSSTAGSATHRHDVQPAQHG